MRGIKVTNRKFVLTDESIEVLGVKLFRIKALKAFSSVEKGELGGFVESEKNLDVSGNAWVSGDAWVYGNARVCGDAWVYGNARVCGDAWVYGNARVSGRFDLTVNIDFELPRITINSEEKLKKLKEFLDKF
jgi:hypothetical protein